MNENPSALLSAQPISSNEVITPEARFDEFVKRRLKKMYLTKGARFEAARRHKVAHRASSFSIVVLSTYVFATSVIVIIFDKRLSESDLHFLNSLNLIMSFFVVAFSLLQNTRRHELRAELFLRCAQSIDSLHSNLSYIRETSEIDYGKVKKIEDDYAFTLENFQDNHSDIDFNIFRYKATRNPENFPMRSTRNYYRFLRLYWRFRQFIYIYKSVILSAMFPWIAFFLFYAFFDQPS